MPKKIRELKAILRKAGFECVRIRGSHERWMHPDVPELPITLAGKDSQDAKPYLEKLVKDALQQLETQESDDEPT
ncbi:type II toxin-antitoxin system HicA family toxin [Laspinema olomoucense]|uniref:Type II toxin-antitoxin system HicA family toxin n=1 Tax=Laspinema olomoucense D3b TaxID=2953688 RepID=A0ABT2NB47_9CYAN|nr:MULTISPECIES: type II toxin-antitoxin system HicA family toxin [unclassified Laspinema]MCT7974077.1 type II toxin-antitoxin system HicA family toxin [Laspinema sp. D3d]MCT7978486.1 type II toxin-antitoxin system HicA family toxin [Laspinema sp. D3b]MCT7991833.1 type II toxin-antitoxin system HicA family toxin [Laspinema sp. D3a]